jgi:hypothetical protein
MTMPIVQWLIAAWPGRLPAARWRRAVLAAVVATCAAAPPLLTARAAEAETFSSRITANVGMYDCTSASALCTTAVTTAPGGTAARMVCWEDGRAAAGSVRWFYVRLANGRQGFVPANRVAAQAAVRSCGDRNASNEIDGVIAARWALGRNGAVDVPRAEQDRLAAVWGVSRGHTYGDWSGDCIGFAVLAWDAAGSVLPRGNAIDVFRHYRDGGRIRTDRNPPRGALVFWNAVSGGQNYGHAEVSLGNGRSIGTQGWDGQRLPVSIATIGASDYLGWAMPS